MAGQLGDPWGMSYANANRIRALIALGRLDDARDTLERHRAISSSSRFATFSFMTHAYEVALLLAAGDLPGAEAAAERAQAMGAADDAPFDAGVYGLQMYAIRRAQGRLTEVAPVMRVLAASADPPPMWRPGLAALYGELEMLDEAQAGVRPVEPVAVHRRGARRGVAGMPDVPRRDLHRARRPRTGRGALRGAARLPRAEPDGGHDDLLRSGGPVARWPGRARGSSGRRRRALPGGARTRRGEWVTAVARRGALRLGSRARRAGRARRRPAARRAGDRRRQPARHRPPVRAIGARFPTSSAGLGVAHGARGALARAA